MHVRAAGERALWTPKAAGVGSELVRLFAVYLLRWRCGCDGDAGDGDGMRMSMGGGTPAGAFRGTSVPARSGENRCRLNSELAATARHWAV